MRDEKLTLRKWLDDKNEDDVIAIGGRTSYLFLGKKRYLKPFLSAIGKTNIMAHKVEKQYRQMGADYAHVAIVSNAGLYKCFALRSECMDHFVDLLLSERKVGETS